MLSPYQSINQRPSNATIKMSSDVVCHVAMLFKLIGQFLSRCFLVGRTVERDLTFRLTFAWWEIFHVLFVCCVSHNAFNIFF